jgi:phasin family protein
MYKASEQLSNANKAGVETFVTLANAAFAGFERLAALNLNTARGLLEDSASTTRALLAVKDPQALISLQASLTKPGTEASLAYSRSVYAIASDTQDALSKVVETQVSDLSKKLDTALDSAVKTAPAGSDLAVSAMRTALSAANSAYDSMTKAAKQAADMAEANLFAAAAYAEGKARKAA